MNRRVLLLIILVIVLGGGALALILTRPPATPAPTDTSVAIDQSTAGPTQTPFRQPTVKVLVAVQNLNRGLTIPADGLAVRDWPIESFPTYGLSDPKDAIGRIVRIDIPRGAPVLSTELVDALGSLSNRGSDAAAVIPKGLVAVAVPIDRLANVAHAPLDGDYVDVIMSFLFVDVDDQFQSILPNLINLTSIDKDGVLHILAPLTGRVETIGEFSSPVIVSPSERQRPRLVTQNTVKHALVVHVGTFPAGGDFLGRRPSPTPLPVTPGGDATATVVGPTPTDTKYDPDIITLAVPPQDAVTLVWAIESGLPMTLALRSAQEGGAPIDTTTNEVTLEYINQQYRIRQPGKLSYALEPRISSIRKLVTENTVPFDTSLAH